MFFAKIQIKTPYSHEWGEYRVKMMGLTKLDFMNDLKLTRLFIYRAGLIFENEC